MRKVDDVHACIFFVLLPLLAAVSVTHFDVEKLVSIDLVFCQFSFVVDMLRWNAPFSGQGCEPYTLR